MSPILTRYRIRVQNQDIDCSGASAILVWFALAYTSAWTQCALVLFEWLARTWVIIFWA